MITCLIEQVLLWNSPLNFRFQVCLSAVILNGAIFYPFFKRRVTAYLPLSELSSVAGIYVVLVKKSCCCYMTFHRTGVQFSVPRERNMSKRRERL